jgi:hypothetical protein
VHEVTRTRFNDAKPLIGLERLGEAGLLLAECQRVFEERADTAMLGKVLTVRADPRPRRDPHRRPEVTDLGRGTTTRSSCRSRSDLAFEAYSLTSRGRRTGRRGAGGWPLALLGGNEAVRDGVARGLHPAAQPELAVDRRHVPLE